MDTKKRLTLSLVFILSFIELLKAEICPTFTCGSLPDALCTKRTSNETVAVQSYVLQKCAKEEQQCPFYNLESFESLTCEDKPVSNIRMYPGGYCVFSKDCIFGTCSDSGVCVGTANGEKCSYHKECNYGFACRRNDTTDAKFCLAQLKEGDSCREDFDCVNSHGCFNHTCTRYFSLADGSAVEDTPAKFASFCQSGYEYNGACARLTLPAKETQCDDATPCNYTNFDKTSVVIPGNCLCGFNPSGVKYCKLGSGHQEYVDYVKNQQNLLKDTSKCNTEERGGVCNYNRRDPAVDLVEMNKKFKNARILAEFSHELVGADQCVIDVAFPEFTPEKPVPPPSPSKAICAKYTCKSREANCVASHFTKNNETMSLNVIVSDVCKKDEFCDIGGVPNTVFYNETDVNGTCKANANLPVAGVRYPGEKCLKNEDCYEPDASFYPDEFLVGTCMFGYCQGYNATQNCSETAWCWTGNYCGEDKTCAPLKKEKENCTQTAQCQNGLLCQNQTCQNAWFSLPVNATVISDNFISADNFCKFGRAHKGVCDYLNTTDTVEKKSGLVVCNPGQKCNYTSLAGAVELDCQCGYNADGKAYCPKGNSQGKMSLYNFS